MRVAKLLAMVFGLVIASLGVAGLAAPSALLEFGRSMQTTHAHYVVAAVRVMFGAILWWVASDSRTPTFLRILGVFIVIAGVVTPLFGVDRARAVLDWWSAQGMLFTQAWSVVAIGFGLFVAYAVAPFRRPAA